MKNLIAEYRQLAVGAETLRALDTTLMLVEKVAGLQVRVYRGSVKVTKAPMWRRHVRSWRPLWDLVEQVDATGNERPVSSRRHQKRQLPVRVRFLRTTWCLVTLPRLLSENRCPESQYSFVGDSLLLLFHQAYFVLLPKLGQPGLAAERNDLISTFFAFAERVPDVAERFRIAGLAYEAKADAVNAVASFEKALSATHVDEHVFMTRLQTFWMALLNNRDFTAALHLLLRFMPMVPLKHLPELRRLILDTFEEYGDACAEGRAAG